MFVLFSLDMVSLFCLFFHLVLNIVRTFIIVYGSSVQETAEAFPSQPYAMSKWIAENLCCQQARTWGIPTICLRLFNVYGTEQHPDFLVPYILNCLLNEQPILLRMPEGLRDFVFVDDVVDAFIQAAYFDRCDYQVLNIGSGQPIKIIDFVKLAAEIWDCVPVIEQVEIRPGELPAMIADISQAKMLLNWLPKHDLQRGLNMMKLDLEASN